MIQCIVKSPLYQLVIWHSTQYNGQLLHYIWVLCLLRSKPDAQALTVDPINLTRFPAMLCLLSLPKELGHPESTSWYFTGCQCTGAMLQICSLFKSTWDFHTLTYHMPKSKILGAYQAYSRLLTVNPSQSYSRNSEFLLCEVFITGQIWDCFIFLKSLIPLLSQNSCISFETSGPSPQSAPYTLNTHYVLSQHNSRSHCTETSVLWEDAC